MKTTREILLAAKAAAPALAGASAERKNLALSRIAERLLSERESILRANEEDILASKDRLGPVMVDRLRLTPERIAGMAEGILDVVRLPDPVGEVLERTERPNGMVIEKTAVPLGVIAIIYESRPNVTSDAAALALKSGNAVILRGGKEAFRSNAAIARAIHLGLEDALLPAELVGSRRPGGPADPPRRRGPHPKLRGEREGALHPDRDRHLPYLRGRVGGPGDGPGHH